MASIEKRGDSYRIVVSNGYSNGTQNRITITYTPTSTTESKIAKEVKEFAANFELQVLEGKFFNNSKLKLKDMGNIWLSTYVEPSLSAPTARSYRDILEKNVYPSIGHFKLQKINPLVLEKLYRERLISPRLDGKQGTIKHSTILKMNAVLSSMFNKAIHLGAIASNPCDKIIIPKLEDKQSVTYDPISELFDDQDDVVDVTYNTFTLEETYRFIDAINMPYTVEYKPRIRKDHKGNPYTIAGYTVEKQVTLQLRVYLLISLFGGFRRGELIPIIWNRDVDFEHNTITITKSAITTDSGQRIKHVPKNTHSIRTVTLPAFVMDMLQEHKIEQEQYIHDIGSKWRGDSSNLDNNFVFTQWNGTPMSLYTPYNTMQKLLKRYNASVDDSLKLPLIPLHSLRHTSATLLISEHVDPKTVQNRLGHSSIQTTMNIYAHALKTKDQAAAETFNNLFDR